MLGEGVGLRHLCDWAYYMGALSNDKKTEEEFLNAIKRSGLLDFGIAITAVCARYLGSYLPGWAKDCDAELCEKIIGDVFLSGNFGVKDISVRYSGVLVSGHGKNGAKGGKFANALKAMHKAVVFKHKKAVRWIIPYPFLYIYECVRYAFLTATGKRPSIKRTAKIATERKKLYKELKIFDIEK